MLNNKHINKNVCFHVFNSFFYKLLAHKLAHLPEERKKLLEHEPSMWNAGWSHGKEKLGDIPDISKGSFYANPLYLFSFK